MTPSDPSDTTIEIRCLWLRTDYGSISLAAAARGYYEREKWNGQKQHPDIVTDERFAEVRRRMAEDNPEYRLVESVVKVPLAEVAALFTDGAEVSRVA